ncbi:MAG: hypothetical protein U9R79_18610 [Armatimonadota bacterium]|nr:hypothetical protein [Armatimonadota bacterium]
MIQIDEPFHGAVLGHRHGVQDESGLTIEVRGRAPVDKPVRVNGAEAQRAGDRFTAELTLTEREQDITAVCDEGLGRMEHTVRVVWDRNSRPRYRFSIDDNSFWLRDVAREGYDSLFDCFYLAILRDLNEKYGAKFTLNIYCEADDGWQITDFPERYRGEFEDNAHWMVLAFHAWSDKPDRPYQFTPPQKVIEDLEAVNEQIVRFAGERTLAPPTVIHWGFVVPEALPLLYEHGVRVLSGSGRMASWGRDVNYWLEPARSEWLARNEALKDFDSGIVFSKGDITCNNVPKQEIVPHLERVASDPRQAEIMDLFTHEQYFWPFYRRYIPDHGERLDEAIRWVTEHGYEPVFFHEGFLGIEP